LSGTRRLRKPQEVAEFLRSRPSLTELSERFPREWDAARREFAALMESGDATALGAALARSSAPVPRPRGRERPQAEVVSDAVRRHMLERMLRQALVAAGTGVTEGSVRLGLVTGFVLQRLLFEGSLRRKPVPLRAFRLVWPLLRQRRRLMPLVSQRGIYCFYSRPLVKALVRLVDGRRCVEIAAGDGTLARFLTEAGAEVTATDDYSWRERVGYDDLAEVEKLDAAGALREYRPQVVICSWPPPGNSFEAHVFTTPSVELYVLITSRHEFAAGNWDAYRAQTGFTFAEEPRLSRMLVPPEIDGAVYLFRRGVADGDEITDGRAAGRA
jgi:hypothetical protein